MKPIRILPLLFLLSFVHHRSIAQQGMGVGTNNPLEMLQVEGAIKVGTDFNNSNAAPTGGAGTIRWNGTDFQGWDGTQWITFSGSGAAGWELTGNAGTTPGTNFIGTTDDQDIVIKRFNEEGLRLSTGGALWASGNSSTGITPASGAGSRLMWIPAKHSFRAGSVTGTQWDNGSIGVGSVAFGEDNTVSGAQGFSSGRQNTSSGAGAVTMGWTNTASGTLSAALGGQQNTASGYGSHAINGGTVASGQWSFASGQQTTASGGSSSSFGRGTTAPSYAEVVVGMYSTNYSPANTTGYDASDRIFNIGNGASNAARSDAFTVLKGGNVGIGVNNPQDELHVQGSVRMVDGNQQAGYIPVSDANGTMTWSDPSTVVGAQAWSLTGNAGIDQTNNFIGTTDNNNVRFLTNNVERMVITTAGRVGVGTVAPVSTFHVAGITTLGDPSSTGATFFNMVRSGSAGRIYLGSGGSTPHMIINAQTANGAIVLNTSTGEVMRAADSGNVGIGTTNPQSKLHVAGAMRMVDGNQAAGFIPVSDANGTMIWTDPATIATADDGDWTVSGNNIYNSNSGFVGVGTTTPNRKLTVGAPYSINMTPIMSVNTTGNQPLLIGETTTPKAVMIGYDGNDIQGRSGTNLITNSDLVLNKYGGNVGVGSATPISKIDVSGSGWFRSSGGGGLASSAGTGLRVFYDSPSNIGQLFAYDYTNAVAKDLAFQLPGGNVGVGTNGPTQKVDVNGKIRMRTGATTGYVPVSDANGTMTWTDPATITTADDGDWTISGNNQYSAVSGNVGIGTTAPATKLHLEGSAIVNANGVSGEGITLRAGYQGRYYQSILAYDHSGNGTGFADGLAISGFDGIGFITNKTDNTYGNVRMFVSQAGNVGIGNLTPNTPLFVEGNTTINANGVSGVGLTLRSGYAGRYHVGLNAYDHSGGGTGYADGLAVSGYDGISFITAKTDATYGNVRMLISQAGNVGIGTTTPADELHVVGSVRMVDGNQAAGYIPVSDASGTMTWTAASAISGVNHLVDADGDTKVQVEESSDEDIIRFDLAGTERWVMTGTRLEPSNSGNSVFIGPNAGSSDDLTANANVFIGNNAGRDNTTGSANVAIGASPLRSNNSNYNVAIGNSLMNSTTAYGTISIGHNSMNNSNGSYNVVLGVQAGINHTSGTQNVFIGSINVAQANVSGSNNIMLGAGSGQSNTGSTNVFIGVGTGSNNTGSGSVFLGHNAGKNELSGNRLYIENSNSSTPLVYGEFDNDILAVNGKLGVGTQAPQDELHVVGNIRMVDGNQAAGYIPVSDASGTMTWTDPTTITTADDGDWTLNGNDMSNANSGNVGIGTTSPDRLLNIESATGPQMLFTRNDNNTTDGEVMGELLFDNNDDTAPSSVDAAAVIRATAAGNQGNSNKGGNILFLTKNSQASGATATERVRISANGNVGFGVSAPISSVDVSGTGWFRSSAGGGLGSTAGTGIRVFYDSPSDAGHLYAYDYASSASKNLVLQQPGGNVGIGVVSPAQKLHMLGTARVENGTLQLYSSDSYEKIHLTNAGTNGSKINHSTGWSVDYYAGPGSSGNTGLHRFFTTDNGYSEKMRIASNGSVGIGTTSPTQKLHVFDSSQAGLQIENSTTNSNQINLTNNNGFWHMSGPRASSNDLNFYWNNGSYNLAMSLGSDGNVGIGNETPAAKLHVSGTGRFSADLYMDNGTRIMPTPGGNYVRLGASGNAFQDVYTRYSYVSTAYSVSDQNMKKDIMPVKDRIDAIAALKSIQPKAFKWDLNKLYGEGAKPVCAADTAWRYGFVAQDIEQVMPETVHRMEETGTLVMNYDAVVSVLFEATRQQQEIIEQEREARQELQAKLDELLLRLEQLESK
ncbi:MAG: hypothetical protein GC178_10750 [Flavobacteriales bacterium]|nr:hypothetical protein [Flavobacteriales bacterium]